MPHYHPSYRVSTEYNWSYIFTKSIMPSLLSLHTIWMSNKQLPMWC